MWKFVTLIGILWGFTPAQKATEGNAGLPPHDRHLLRINYDGNQRYLSFWPGGYFVIADFAFDPNYRGEIRALRIPFEKREAEVSLRVYLFKQEFDSTLTRRQMEAAPQELAAEFTLTEGAPETLNLARHGLGRLELELVPAETDGLTPLEIWIDTPSLSLAELVEQHNAFVLTLSNSSPKAVLSLHVGDRAAHGALRKPLIPPFGVFRWEIPRFPAGEEGSSPERAARIHFRSAVFEDFTFEGDAESALRYVLGLRGQQLGIPAVLELIREALAGDLSDTQEAAVRLFRRLREMESEQPPAGEAVRWVRMLAPLTDVAPERLEQYLESGFRWSRTIFVREFQANVPRQLESDAPARLFEAFLQGCLRRYGSNLEALQTAFEAPRPR